MLKTATVVVMRQYLGRYSMGVSVMCARMEVVGYRGGCSGGAQNFESMRCVGVSIHSSHKGHPSLLLHGPGFHILR